MPAALRQGFHFASARHGHRRLGGRMTMCRIHDGIRGEIDFGGLSDGFYLLLRSYQHGDDQVALRCLKRTKERSFIAGMHHGADDGWYFFAGLDQAGQLITPAENDLGSGNVRVPDALSRSSDPGGSRRDQLARLVCATAVEHDDEAFRKFFSRSNSRREP